MTLQSDNLLDLIRKYGYEIKLLDDTNNQIIISKFGNIKGSKYEVGYNPRYKEIHFYIGVWSNVKYLSEIEIGIELEHIEDIARELKKWLIDRGIEINDLVGE